jgi:Cu(I)/Ag(I) efflux system membrane protein CusA/SilA
VGGKVVGTALDGRRRLPIRVRYAPDFRADLDRIGRVLVGDRAPVPLAQVAALRLVEGPSMIRGENGLLAAYVQLNVRGRDLGGFMEEAQRAVASQVRVPEGVALEWGGQYEHQLSARRTLTFVLPVVVVLIFLILFLTWRDAGDAALILLTVPGALVGGLVLQWLLGHPFSVAVWVGYIACFGLATETGIIVLTYMREALQRRGGLEAIGSEAELEAAVLEGAVQRLRPKLLTEGVIILGLLPMLWATGVGAELLRPMAAPVLGGILVADEVVDLAIPALFFWLRRRRWRALQAARPTTGARRLSRGSEPPAPAAVTG